MGDVRNAYKILAGKPEGKRPLKRNRRGWKDNIKNYISVVNDIFIILLCAKTSN
jgi:hypothetical protein